MADFPYAIQERIELHADVEQRLTASLKLLLETKHLYQSATLDLVGRARAIKPRVAKAKWHIVDKAVSPSASRPQQEEFTLRVPDVKLFCHVCNRTEAFNSISAEDFTERGPERDALVNDAVQVFVLSFECQSCKDVPDVFLLRRQGVKLTLCGRAPIEIIEVPPAIPKTVQGFYSGGVVAQQSGQTLAGLFLLRTLIEQWARSQVKSAPQRADELMDRYMGTLPKDFKSRFPSMRQLYDDISADIHGAIGSADLFDRARADVAEHFEARRLFKLS